MIKVFLSHSSKDKSAYIRQVVSTLKINNIVYDELTFEPGMLAIDEIFNGIEKSSLFVVFLSNESLNSKWVKDELTFAKEKLDQNQIDRIYPILIDKSISYSDERIPEWMKQEYNLRLIARPATSARKIRQRLKEISWKVNPILKARNNIFVGRNDIIRSIEETMDDFDRTTPAIINASGLARIGRSSLLKKSIEKCNIISNSYEFPHIYLSDGESIEDLIVKIYDLGFSEEKNIYDLINIDYETKLQLCLNLIRDIRESDEILLIHDDGCLIDYKGEFRGWFDDIANEMVKSNKLQWIIASSKRLAPPLARKKDYIYSINIPELSLAERKGLFKRALDVYFVDISNDDISKFSDLLSGFPDQVFFACEQISDYGAIHAWKKSHEITYFNSERASIILSGYSDNQDILDFIYLISKFEFISQNFLFLIEPNDKFQEILPELIVKSICDYVGSDRDFIRLNDSIRDYVQRNRLVIPEKYKTSLNTHLEDFLANPSHFDDDISDILYSIKEAIKSGRIPPDKYLIPSHFLKSIRELYHHKKHLTKVIDLSDKFLQKESVLEKYIVDDVRYYLCLALARRKNKRFLDEVHNLHGPEHNFLMGFYYRLTNRPKDAIEKLNKCLQYGSVSTRAKRELVQVYISIDDYQAAENLAKDNYEDYSTNPYHIQAYLNTTINSNNKADNSEKYELIEKLINELLALGTKTSQEMAERAKAEYIAKCKKDYATARVIIAEAVHKFPDSHYPSLSQASLAAKFKDKETLVLAYNRLKEMSKNRDINQTTLDQLKASIMSMEGDVERAIKHLKLNLKSFPESALQEAINRLRIISSNE